MKHNGLHIQCGLNTEETVQVHALAGACCDSDGVSIKFNYGMIARRKPDELSDFCWLHDGVIAGYMPLDRFGNKGEITAAVQPELRRQGVFRALYDAALDQAKSQGYAELLLVSYRNSTSGTAVIKQLGLPYVFSEYCMKARKVDVALPQCGSLYLETVTCKNVGAFAAMLTINFPDNPWSTLQDVEKEISNELDQPEKSDFLAYLGETPVGHIGVARDGSASYIRCVGILPEHRRKGYGRQMLAETLRLELAAGAQAFELDVATENESALGIYTACGFRSSNVYDYYKVF